MDRLIKRESFIKNFIITTLLILILIVEGCFNFVQFGFKWERLLELDFWSYIISSVILLILIRVLSILIIQPIIEKNNKELIYQKHRNDKLMLARGNDINSWTYWIDCIKNIYIKKEKHIENINLKLSKLNERSKDRDRQLWYDKSEEKKYLKDINKYCQKRSLYELELDNQWIEDNINNIYVKGASKLNPNVFDLPVCSSIKVDKYKVNGKTKLAITIAVLLAVIIMLFINVLKRTIDYSNKDIMFLSVFINLIIDILLMGGQIISAWMDSIKIVNNEILLPYTNRNNIIIEYIYYKNQDNPQKVKDLLLNINTEAKSLTDADFEKGA